LAARNHGPLPEALPFFPWAGTLRRSTAVGKDVGGFAVGDEVNVIPSFSLNDYSTMAMSSSYRTMPLSGSRNLFRSPRPLQFG
jgi:hypothetical protein